MLNQPVESANLVTVSGKDFNFLSERVQAVIGQRYVVHITALGFDEIEAPVYELTIYEQDGLLLQDGLGSDEIFAGEVLLHEFYAVKESSSESQAELELYIRACNFINNIK